MTVLDSPIPRFHLAIPVDHLDAAPVDDHDAPVPPFGLLLSVAEFHRLAERLRANRTEFVLEPYLRFEGQTGEQWTKFLLDPAGNALQVEAFADDSQVFVTEGAK